MSQLNIALSAARHGLHVFPARPGGKREYSDRDQYQGTRAYRPDATRKHASTDEAVIAQWWTETPSANVKAIVGDGVVGVDVDSRSGGIESLALILDQFGALPETFSGESPPDPKDKQRRCGLRLFFRVPDGLRTRSVLASDIHGLQGIEIIGTGGAVMIGGRITNRGDYTFNDAEIADAPAWLVELLQEHQPQSRTTTTAATATEIQRTGDGFTPYGEAALVGEVMRLRSTQPGNRARTLNTVAFRLGQLVPHGHLTEAVIRRDLGNATDEWKDARKIAKIVERGIAAGIRNPRVITPRADRTANRRAIDSLRQIVQRAQWAGYWDARNQRVNGTAVRLIAEAMLRRASDANRLAVSLSEREAAELAHMTRRTARKGLQAMVGRGMCRIVKRDEIHKPDLHPAARAYVYELTARGWLALRGVSGMIQSCLAEGRAAEATPTTCAAPLNSSPSKTPDWCFSDTPTEATPTTAADIADAAKLGIFAFRELGRSAYTVLQNLTLGTANITSLSARTGLSKSTVRRALAKCVAAGFVRRANAESEVEFEVTDADTLTYRAMIEAEARRTAQDIQYRATRHAAERQAWRDRLANPVSQPGHIDMTATLHPTEIAAAKRQRAGDAARKRIEAMWLRVFDDDRRPWPEREAALAKAMAATTKHLPAPWYVHPEVTP